MMQKLDYRRFMSVLHREKTLSTLFEPFLSDYIAEMLIWRRDASLWRTPDAYVSTLLSVSQRTAADIICADTRRFDREALPVLYEQLEALDGDIRAVAICRDEAVLRYAESCAGVCAVAVYEAALEGGAIPNKPYIMMDGTPEDAFRRGADGYYAPQDAQTLLVDYGERMCILGGIGARWISESNPRDIYERVHSLYSLGGYYAIGTGRADYGEYREDNVEYLNEISLLGAYARCR